MYSQHQAIYFKNYLTLKDQGNNIERLNTSLHESKISLNPHQINAALIFFKDPLNKGFIFADEVGLGKTIEAGLIISQYWYERKRRIMIICPASLIKQWNEELFNKFRLNSIILDSKTIKNKNFKWEDNIYITSIHSIYLNRDFFNLTFNLVVIDEAHKLRNVYKDNGIMASAIKEVFAGQKKLLLTATPFQNNLMELFGLISLLDEHIFPDEKVFKEKYIKNYEQNKKEFHSILSNYIIRTLRKDVSKYINYTNRNVILADYYTTKKEKEFYNKVSNILYSSDFSESYTLGQNQLLIILLQKLLSSSIYAVTSTLKNMRNNLLEKNNFNLDDFGDESTTKTINYVNSDSINGLINNLNEIIDFSKSIQNDSKFECLLSTLNNIYDLFSKDVSRNKKILIFTESKKTQQYLYTSLVKNGYTSIITFNGENDVIANKKIYNHWLEKNKNTHSNNKNANLRRAIIDAFENEYDILIATDSAAEGLNMQFCSVVINYDLPWNPQKIEQRIGRCHRYGQKNDVIVLNLLNRSNSIDQRIYDLLNSKLGIFESTFGSSDLILGNDNIADNIESSIREVYKKSRSPEEIERMFKELQNKFKKEIESSIRQSENEMENFFDEEVQRNFEFQYISAKNALNEYDQILCKLIKYVYPQITIDNTLCFQLNNINYTITNNDSSKEFVSLNTPFGIKVINQIPDHTQDISFITFDYYGSDNKIGYLESLSTKKGRICVSKIIYDSFELIEALVLTCIMDDGSTLPSEIIHKLLKLPCSSITNTCTSKNTKLLYSLHVKDINNKIKSIEEYNNLIFTNESNYIDNWADSMIEKIQLNVKKMREKRKELQKQFDFSINIEEKTKLQKQIAKLSKKITKSWIELAGAEDDINERRNNLISNLLSEKNKKVECKKLFELEFEIK